MTLRKTFQWTVILVAMIAAGGWYAVKHLLDHKDRLVLQGIREEVSRKIPEWGVTIGDARFDMSGRVWLTDITIAPQPGQPPLVTIPRCLVTVDPNLLLEHQQLRVRSVSLIQPQVLVTRAADGTWNWQGLSRPAPSDQTPEITIDQGELHVRLQAADGFPQTEVGSRNVNLRLVPDGHRRYLIEGASQIDGAGALAFGGKLDLNSGAWQLIGEAQEVDMSQGLLEKAAAFAPELGQRVAELSGTAGASSQTTVIPGAAQPPANQDERPVQAASHQRSVPTPQLSLPNLGLTANIGLAFELSSDGTQAVPDYRVGARVISGTVTEPLSPVPLSNLQGELFVENGNLLINEFSASNGESRFSLSGTMQQDDGRMIRNFDVSASNLLIDNELRYFLPASCQRLFDRIRPAGLFTVRGRFQSDGTGSPVVRLDEFLALDCSMRHELFPYPVTGIRGTVKQEGDSLTLDLQGQASGQPVRIKGSVNNPGPEAEATIAVQVNGLPLDQLFVQSLVAPKQHPARKTIESLGLTGLLEINARFVRAAGLNQPVVMGIDADLSQGTMNYERFPYVLSQISGHITFDPWTEPVWHFTNLSGKHGGAKVTGTATYDLGHPEGELLDLQLDAHNVTFDRELYQASTTAVPELLDAWDQLRPEWDIGSANFDDVHLTWTPGTSPQIELPSIQVSGAAVTPKSFPFRWENVSASLNWSNGRATIHQLQARHRETQLDIERHASPSAVYFQLHPPESDARWQLHVNGVSVRNLDPGPEFRQALSGGLAAAVSRLNPRGPIDVEADFDMKGFPDPRGGAEIVTARWNLGARLQQDRLSVGLDLTDVTGKIETTGQYNEQVDMDGVLHFERARTLDTTFTDIQGPFTVDGHRVTLGSSIMLQNARPGMPETPVPLTEQLTARVYGGSVECNADITVHPNDDRQTSYQARVELKNADLKEWAAEWGYEKADVVGTARSHLQLYGQGTSELGLRGEDCWMTITDARLGELPIVAQMMRQIVAPQQRDKTAFRYAFLDFSIHDGLFDFGPRPSRRAPADKRRIHLAGDMFNMDGFGYVPFAPQLDPQMDLNFYSKADKRNPFLQIPLVGAFAKTVSDNWFHVRVTGPPENPQIRTSPEVPVDNALRQFLGVLEAGLTTPRPFTR